MKSLIQKLNILKESTKPRQEWLVLEKAKLLEQLKVFSYSKPDIRPGNASSWTVCNFILTLKPMAVSGLILVLFFSGLGLVLASRDSLPGELLYQVKISLERAKMRFTLAQDKKTELQMEITTRRIEELVKIGENPERDLSQEKKVKEGVKNFQREISLLKNNLNKLEEKVSPQKVAAVTEVVDSRSQEYKKILRENSQNLFPSVQEDLSEALDSVQELSLAVSKIKEGQEMVRKGQQIAADESLLRGAKEVREEAIPKVASETKRSYGIVSVGQPSSGLPSSDKSEKVEEESTHKQPTEPAGSEKIEEETSGQVSIPLESKEGTVWIDLGYEH